MKALVTGASGFIGFHVAKLLTGKGVRVVALVRKGSDTSALTSLDIETVSGDVTDFDSICSAMKGCDQVYHLAADYRLWVPDPDTMYEINVGGTKNIMRAAKRLGAAKIVYTSSVGTLTATSNGMLSTEESLPDIREMVGHYKRSKFIAEREVRKYIEEGLPVVIVHPSTPIGSMDRKPTPTGKMIVDFLNGKMPAYLDTGLNFVDVEDVAAGHWFASLHGRTGQGYILGNKNLTLRDFFEALARLTGRQAPKVRLPYFPVLLAAYADEAVSRLTRKHPTIPLTGVKMARKYMFFDCSKAIRELNMPQSPVEGAMQKAIDWFIEEGYVRKVERHRPPRADGTKDRQDADKKLTL